MMLGIRRRITRGLLPVWQKRILTRRIIPSAIHKRGSDAVAAVTGVRARCVSLRLSVDYVVRDVRGAPRGRKFGAGRGVMNPR
jgi:hypothetical protein